MGNILFNTIQDGHRNALRHLLAEIKKYYFVPDDVYKKLHILHSNCFQNYKYPLQII